MARSCKVVGR